VQSTGPPGWGLGVVLTTPPRNKFLVTKPHINKIFEAAKVFQELYSHEGGGGGEEEEEEEE